MQELKRNRVLDILKGLTIILVVFGHSIQYGSGYYFTNEIYFDNPLFKIIYSFHMPLFALISGYLFYYSLKKYDLKELIKNKITTLFIPIFTSSLIYFLISKFILHVDISLVKSFLSFLWFLWAILFSSIIISIVNKKFNDNKFIYLFGFLFIFILPDFAGLNNIKFIYIYFFIGYIINKLCLLEKLQLGGGQVLLLSLILFNILILFYNRDAYIYGNGFSIININSQKIAINFYQLAIGLYRIIMGLVGSLLTLSLVKAVMGKLHSKILKALSYLGQNTLGIYIIQSFFMELAIPYICHDLKNINYLICILITILIIGISLLLIQIIKKNSLANRLILGGRK